MFRNAFDYLPHILLEYKFGGVSEDSVVSRFPSDAIKKKKNYAFCQIHQIIPEIFLTFSRSSKATFGWCVLQDYFLNCFHEMLL